MEVQGAETPLTFSGSVADDRSAYVISGWVGLMSDMMTVCSICYFCNEGSRDERDGMSREGTSWITVHFGGETETRGLIRFHCENLRC